MFLGVDFLKYLDVEAPCLSTTCYQHSLKISNEIVCVVKIKKVNMAKCS